ncbi:MAG: nuclear transport factor 2 family protein [Waterburya sp.]
MSNQILPIELVIKEYLAAWNTSDSEARLSLISNVLAPNCLYVDAHLSEPVITRELHSQFIKQFRSKFPDLKISLVSTPDAHHGFFRFRWQLTKPNGDIFTQGIFFGEVNQDNKILKLVGFVDQ